MSKSRAEYFKMRRQSKGQFYAMVDKDILKKLDMKLKARNISRAAWLLKCMECEMISEGE
jgi:hypothetical protein